MFYPGLTGLCFVEEDGISPDLPQQYDRQRAEEFEISPTEAREIVKVGDLVTGKVLAPKLHCGDWILCKEARTLTVLEIYFEASVEAEDNYWDSKNPKAVNLSCPIPGNWIFKLEDPEDPHPEYLMGCEISLLPSQHPSGLQS